MKILLTGANGFLGRNMQEAWANGHEVISLGRGIDNSIQCDLKANCPPLPPVDMVVHAAGKAHTVPTSAEESEDFFKVNVNGTLHLLKALEHQKSLQKFVLISTVSVYGLKEGINVKEDSPLLSNEPYGKSKIEAEYLVREWCSERAIPYFIFRLPLVAGTKAPGNLGAMVKGIKKGRYVSIGKGKAKKSMVLAADIADIAIKCNGPAGSYNLADGYHPSFSELEDKISLFYGKKKPYSLPFVASRVLGFAGDIIGKRFPVNTSKIKKITSTLTFDDAKARTFLHWRPNQVLNNWNIE